MNFIMHYNVRIKKFLLSTIFILLSIVFINFFYHEYLFSKATLPENITDYAIDKKFISYNQDYTSTLINIKHLDSEKLSLTLNDTIINDDVTWEYSIDNGEKWIKTDLKEILIEKQIINSDYILISIKNNTLNEENDFKIEIPKSNPPIAAISYSTTEPTTDPVTATIISTTSNIKITNNKGLNTYTFNKNGEFTFEYTDEDGNTFSTTAKVDWIIDEPITVDISYDIPSITNEPVTASIQTDDKITITNNNGKSTYTFKENGNFTFEYIDENGNKNSITASVTWIDKIPPQAKITYDITEKTTEEVTATLTNANENIIITNNDGLDSYTFKENDEFTFIFQDEAGNTSQLTASVTWIEKSEDIPEPSEEILPDDDQPNKTYLSKDAISKKTIYTNDSITVKVPTYRVNEALILKKEDIKINKNIKEYVGNKSQGISVSLLKSNNTQTNLNTNMNISFELDPEKTFLGIYRLNNDIDLEELNYKKTDKNHIELELTSLGNYILSYAKKEFKPIKIKSTASDLQVIILFATSIALIVTGITVYKKSRE